MGPSHNIALFIDGTWNEPSPNQDTNVRKLFDACLFMSSGATPQITYYLPGVGTDIKQSGPGLPVGLFGPELTLRADIRREMPYVLSVARPLIGGGFGLGTQARIKEAYAYLCTQFVRQRQDKVFLFGFSRGAFAARSLAGFVSRVGTLLATKLHLVETAYGIYEDGLDPEDTLLSAFLEDFAGAKMIRSIEDEDALPIHFLGVWDTVGALGLPSRLRKFTARHTEHHQVDVPPGVVIARHALALHELRSLFAPLLFARGKHPQLEQVWFPGAHADVGGGYECRESGLSEVALRWMADQASSKGLLLDEASYQKCNLPAAKVVHHEIRKWFLFAAPTVRTAVKDLYFAAEPGAADPACALYFHRSVAAHLESRGIRKYEFWRYGVNRALDDVDNKALQLYVAARLAGRQSRVNKAGDMNEEPDQVSSPALPWWRTASLEELHRSASLVDEFIGRAEGRCRDCGEESLESLARAMALNTLLVDDDKFHSLLTLANARLDASDDALAHGANDEKHAVCGESLPTAQAELAVLQRCAELLSKAVSGRVEKALSDLAKRCEALNTACVRFPFLHGTRSSIQAPAVASFKPGHRGPNS